MTINWQTFPWRKVVLVAGGGALAALASLVPDTVHIAGVSIQHALIAVAGALAGWAKRAPGDVKAE